MLLWVISILLLNHSEVYSSVRLTCNIYHVSHEYILCILYQQYCCRPVYQASKSNSCSDYQQHCCGLTCKIDPKTTHCQPYCWQISCLDLWFTIVYYKEEFTCCSEQLPCYSWVTEIYWSVFPTVFKSLSITSTTQLKSDKPIFSRFWGFES